MQPSLGKMSAYKMLNWRDRAASSVEQTVAAFLEIGEAIATRWIQTAKGVLLLQMVPDNGASGAIYVFDRQREQWYMLSFEGCEDQFTSEKFDRAFSEYDLFRLVEQPGLLLTEFQGFQQDPIAHLATPPTTNSTSTQEGAVMRLSAGRIRSINRAISRVQSSAWSAPVRNPHRTLVNPPLAVSPSAAEFVRVVVVPRAATL